MSDMSWFCLEIAPFRSLYHLSGGPVFKNDFCCRWASVPAKHETQWGHDGKSASSTRSRVTASLPLHRSLFPIFLFRPRRWLKANAPSLHPSIPPHPFLANRCEILDTAWICLPGGGEKKRGASNGLMWGIVFISCNIYTSLFPFNQHSLYHRPSYQMNVTVGVSH